MQWKKPGSPSAESSPSTLPVTWEPSGFPLLVALRDDAFKSADNGGHVRRDDGSDIHFLSGEGDALAYRIESYCPDDGALTHA